LVIGSMTPRMVTTCEPYFRLHYAHEILDLPAYMADHALRLEAVAINGTMALTAETLAQLPDLKIVSSYGVGYDTIDVQAAVDRNVVVTHTPDVLNNDVANTAILLLLAVSRRVVRDDRWVRNGKWGATGKPPLARSVEGSTVGILGLGRIGETVARKLQAFNCTVCYHSRSPKPHVPYTYFDSPVALAEQVDSLIVVTPGGTGTQKLVDRPVLDALGPQGTLINIARGSVVDESALVSTLLEGRLGNAGLDVFEQEPHVPEALLALDQVVLLPHMGSATVETRQAMGDLVVENLVRYATDGTVSTPVPECAALAAALTQ